MDVTNWGRSAHDQADSIVVLSEGKVIAAGPRADVPIPKGVRVIDCTGKFLIPGLVDGFAGMNSQGQANAFLYMGVTTVVASADATPRSCRHGRQPQPASLPARLHRDHG